MTQPSRKSGFTLIEMAIVLIVLALLVGGVLAGKSMIRSAEIRTILSELEGYRIAVANFQDRYNALPGDMADATEVWGTATTCPLGAALNGDKRTCNGDGDGLVNINDSPERFRFWQHLANAGLISGRYTGVRGSGSSDHHVIGQNCPASKVGTYGWRVKRIEGTYGTGYLWQSFPNSNYLSFGTERAASDLYDSTLTAVEAYNMDLKIDDGKPAEGSVWSRLWDCTTATSKTDYARAEYKVEGNIPCTLLFFRIGTF